MKEINEKSSMLNTKNFVDIQKNGEKFFHCTMIFYYLDHLPFIRCELSVLLGRIMQKMWNCDWKIVLKELVLIKFLNSNNLARF